MKYLYDSLIEYGKSPAYPFHMPGHKRNRELVNPFSIDITEIEGFDNLFHAEGILKEAQERAASLYGAEETHFLVNGSTCGILSAVSACTKMGGKILIARNCHKAAYHAVLLRELRAEYLYPQKEGELGINGGITPQDVEKALKADPKIQAVMITSPTYDGVVMAVREIADIVHAYGIPLIVDEAHGAHFGFHPFFPESAVKQGADIVIHSLHKTLPSLTQTSLLHVNGQRVDRERLKLYLGIYQTSSPSYVFMASMDECIRLLESRGIEMFEELKDRLVEFYKEAAGFNHIRTGGVWLKGKSGICDFDRSKLILSVKGTDMDGYELLKILRDDHQLELEMAAGTYALALTTIGDTKEGFNRLTNALKQIDGERNWHLTGPTEDGAGIYEDVITENPIVYRLSEALEYPRAEVSFVEAAGRVSGEFLYLYPPGIPLLVPGERITGQLISRAEQYRKRGYSLQGLADYRIKKIQIINTQENEGT